MDCLAFFMDVRNRFLSGMFLAYLLSRVVMKRSEIDRLNDIGNLDLLFVYIYNHHRRSHFSNQLLSGRIMHGCFADGQGLAGLDDSSRGNALVGIGRLHQVDFKLYTQHVLPLWCSS